MQETLQDKTTEVNEEYAGGAFDDMKEMEKWQHEYAHVLNAGRILHINPVKEELLESDKYIPRLRGINEDDRK